MIGRHTGFIAHCKGDPEFPNFMHYHCIIHQEALCAKVFGFGHVMTLVVTIINGTRSRAKQHRTFKVQLEELSAEYGDLLLNTAIRWLSKRRILLCLLSLLSEIKEFMQSKGEDTSQLEDTERTLDLAFLTDITGKPNHLNCELQYKKNKKVLHFPSVQMVLKDSASASETFDKVINGLGQEFKNRFCDLDQLEPCVTPNFWHLVKTEKYRSLCTAAIKIASLFGSTYLCESAFSDMNFIKNKHRTHLTDAHLQDSLRVAVSNYTPDDNTLVNSQSSY
ncbi:general transcription factor II-I repeat domain-containing protein 2-like [Silurus asotus]|uniref:General transcription factor II-I repeat domain-containing protein 2-like n=1 Tax=Silurus asotus TaxID=30991 RepID=A0AAD5AQI2_SILAS|nr:general transcription factor II-I repeat domain-containing protein 2-like [Silurus asotus]